MFTTSYSELVVSGRQVARTAGPGNVLGASFGAIETYLGLSSVGAADLERATTYVAAILRAICDRALCDSGKREV